MKPKSIQSQLRDKNVDILPTLKQIQNTIYRKKCKKFQTQKISLVDLSAWLRTQSVVPEDEKESQIFKAETSTSTGCSLHLRMMKHFFRFVVSSKSGLKYAH